MKIHSVKNSSIQSNEIDTMFVLNGEQLGILNKLIQNIKKKKKVNKGPTMAGTLTKLEMTLGEVNYLYSEKGSYSLLDDLLGG